MDLPRVVAISSEICFPCNRRLNREVPSSLAVIAVRCPLRLNPRLAVHAVPAPACKNPGALLSSILVLLARADGDDHTRRPRRRHSAHADILMAEAMAPAPQDPKMRARRSAQGASPSTTSHDTATFLSRQVDAGPERAEGMKTRGAGKRTRIQLTQFICDCDAHDAVTGNEDERDDLIQCSGRDCDAPWVSAVHLAPDVYS